MNQLTSLLSVLNVDKDVKDVTFSDINAAFRKLALKLHPDKAGDEHTAAFQQVRNAHELLHKYFLHKGDTPNSIDDEKESFFRDYFQNFNFPHENQGSFTVMIENTLAETWKNQLELLLGKPNIVTNQQGTECDRHWKILYSGVQLTLHLYSNPKNKKGSKLLLQGGSQSLLCSYVFDKEILCPYLFPMIFGEVPKYLTIFF